MSDRQWKQIVSIIVARPKQKSSADNTSLCFSTWSVRSSVWSLRPSALGHSRASYRALWSALNPPLTQSDESLSSSSDVSGQNWFCFAHSPEAQGFAWSDIRSQSTRKQIHIQVNYTCKRTDWFPLLLSLDLMRLHLHPRWCVQSSINALPCSALQWGTKYQTF